MDSNQPQTSKERAVEKKQHEDSLAATTAKQKSPASSSPAAASAASPPPPSASSSPSHEFSFTISRHSPSPSPSSSSSTTKPTTSSTVPDISNNKTKTIPPPFAIDLSPADEIFFHGHLLPLHLLSHLPVSPLSSTNSLHSFNLPIKDSTDDQKPEKRISSSCNNIETHKLHQQMNNLDETKGRAKSKSFSLFGFSRRGKGYEGREVEDSNNNNNKDQKQRKKMRFDASHVIKKYVRMVRSLLIFRGRRENGQHFPRQPYSFSSGNISFRNKQDQLIRGGRRGEFSAPASIRTSPTNSGLLVATTSISSSSSSTSDSTMEELQAAIQAAIAHCKNSISKVN